MTSNVYDINDKVKLEITFTQNSVAADPTAVTLKVQDPSGNETSYTYALGQITKAATGNYYKEISVDEAGEWYYRFEGTGGVVAAGENMFYVRQSQF